MSARHKHADVVAGLRELADFIEAHPRLPVRLFRASVSFSVTAYKDAAGFRDLRDIAIALGVNAELDDEPDRPHPHASRAFSGGVEYEAYYVTDRSRRAFDEKYLKPKHSPVPAAVDSLPAAAQDVTGVEEVAGPVAAGPATAPVRSFELGKAGEHYMAIGVKGDEPGDCGAECKCGVGFYGFDSLGEAVAHLDKHIANPELLAVESDADALDQLGVAATDPGEVEVWCGCRRDRLVDVRPVPGPDRTCYAATGNPCRSLDGGERYAPHTDRPDAEPAPAALDKATP